jgi:uncharacterized protein YbaA (DUF1428 family)
MAKYVDGYVLSVPKKNQAAYRKMAREGAAIWKKLGALEYRECRADDVSGETQYWSYLALLFWLILGLYRSDFLQF